MSERNISRRDFMALIGKATLVKASQAFPVELLPNHEHSPSAIPVNTFGQRGTLRGGSGLGFTDEGIETTSAEELLQVAIARHIRMEEAFQHPLDAMLIIPTFYPRNGTENTFSEHTGDIIRSAFSAFNNIERDLKISIEIQPPAWYSLVDTAAIVEQIMTGQFNNLPRELLVEHVHKLSISYDFELVVWNNTRHDPNVVHNFVKVSEFNEILHRPYLEMHKQLQREHSSGGTEYNASSRVYNFGTNDSDDFYIIDADFAAEVEIDLDTIGSREQKALSADNFYHLYNRYANMMFFLYGSPHLGRDQSDPGFAPWDYRAVARWVRSYSRGTMVMVQ
jgi:hypothetical protein